MDFFEEIAREAKDNKARSDSSEDDGFDPVETAVVSASSSSSAVLMPNNPNFDQAVARAVFDAECRCSRQTFSLPSLPRGSVVRMPWQARSGESLWKNALDTALVRERPIIFFTKIDQPPAQQSQRIATGRTFPRVARMLPLISWPVQVAAKRHNALAKWRIIIEENFGASS